MRHIMAMTAVTLTTFAATPSVALDENHLQQLNSTGSGFPHCDLTNADLSGADLFIADLSGADLEQANLTGADMTNAVLCNTTMKDGSVDNSGCP